MEITPDAESTKASDAKYTIISQPLELTLFIIWLTSKCIHRYQREPAMKRG
jgi:hypothetical protein